MKMMLLSDGQPARLFGISWTNAQQCYQIISFKNRIENEVAILSLETAKDGFGV